MASLADLFPPGTDLCQIPSGQPPPGVVPNFNDPGLRVVVITISVITTTIAAVFGICRLLNNIRKLTVSDAFVFLAIVGNIAIAVTMIVWAKYFRHQWNLPLCWLNGKWEQISYVWQIVFCFSLFFSKTATLLLYLRIFTVSRSNRIAIWVGIAITFLMYGSSVGTLSYFAAPHAGETWDELLVKVVGTVIFPLKWGVAQGVVGTLLDIYIFILPLPPISRLKLALKKKIQLVALFAVGGLGVVASIVSLVYRSKSIQGNPDLTLNTGILLTCNLVEMNVALLVCSTPAVASFMRVHVLDSRIMRSLRSSLRLSGHGHSKSDLAADSEDKMNPNRPRTGRSKGNGPKQQRRGGGAPGNPNAAGYVDMSDTWLLNSGATVDIEAPPRALNQEDPRGLNVHKDGGYQVRF
ncbi:uncharacterized protein PG986_012435 [Apiospora aurea]|uniref:Rhodopsin domain-containing protein n=1 Tax=Apiospora aurea TaxID=335848 RepID=A0ABR1PZZ0_9PEZI